MEEWKSVDRVDGWKRGSGEVEAGEGWREGEKRVEAKRNAEWRKTWKKRSDRGKRGRDGKCKVVNSDSMGSGSKEDQEDARRG